MEEKVFQLGSWSSPDHLEESLTMTELHRLFMSQQETEYNNKVFTASLKGVKMDPWQDPDENQSSESDTERFDRIKKAAAIKAAKANGDIGENYVDPESSGLDGFGFESEDD